MPFTLRDGVKIHWEEKGEGTPVLLIMGHRYRSAMWYPILPALTAAHRTIWFDNRGAGHSGYSRKLTVGEMAADAFAVMDAAGVERAHVFGVSMGGGIALEMAIQRPERLTSLILGCTGALTAEKRRMPAIMRGLYYLPPWALRMLLSGGRGNHAKAGSGVRDSHRRLSAGAAHVSDGRSGGCGARGLARARRGGDRGGGARLGRAAGGAVGVAGAGHRAAAF